MLHRRRVALALLERLGGAAHNLDFEKLLFLLCQEQSRPSYHFVPYKYGCFSFESYADKRALTRDGLLADDDKHWVLAAGAAGTQPASESDRDNIDRVASRFGHLHGNALVRHVYTSFPYFAINSTIASRVLTRDELRRVRDCRPKVGGARLLTIGYEGRDVDQYLNELVSAGVQVLCDVRRNAYSMKYGFSQAQLAASVRAMGMQYVHLPRLGIDGSKRRSLASAEDYRILFDEYEKTTLVAAEADVACIAHLLGDGRVVALTCFERDPSFCHRSRVARAVLRQTHSQLTEL